MKLCDRWESMSQPYLLLSYTLGFSILIVASLSAPSTKSATGVALWLANSLAWFTAAAVVFLPLLLWNTFKVIGRERDLDAHRRLAAELEDSEDEQMKSFLRNSLSDPWYGVAKCYVFGSVVGKYPKRDVDVIIQFDSSKERMVRDYRNRLRNIESSFQEFHNLALHVQTFLPSENGALCTFLAKAGMYERIK